MLEEESGTLIFDESLIDALPKDRIIVLGYTKEHEKEEKRKLGKLMKEINIATNYGFRFMMFMDRLDVQKGCEVY